MIMGRLMGVITKCSITSILVYFNQHLNNFIELIIGSFSFHYVTRLCSGVSPLTFFTRHISTLAVASTYTNLLV